MEFEMPDNDITLNTVDVEQMVREYILSVGAKPKYSGFTYAIDLITDCVKENNPHYSLGKSLEKTCSKYGKNFFAVQHGVITMISHTNTPTSLKEFITSAADLIKSMIAKQTSTGQHNKGG